MAIAEITAVMTSLKAATDIAKGMKDLNDSVEINTKVIDLQNEILNLQTGLLSLQENYSNLLLENNSLKNTIENTDNWKKTKEGYSLLEISEGVFVYQSDKEELKHWLCATCFDNGKKSILQLRNKSCAGHVYTCNACESQIIDHSKKQVVNIEQNSSWV